MTPSRSLLVFLCLTACLNLATIGLTVPVSPYIVGQFIADPGNLAWHNSTLFTVYNICAFAAIPLLGSLSDRFGRRPLLSLCLLGSTLGYIIFALATDLPTLYASRVLDGVTGGNFAILFAIMADHTNPGTRTKYFGLLGAASGMGFVVGPGLGTLVASMGTKAPVWVAAGLFGFNFLWALRALPSVEGDHEATSETLNPFASLLAVGDVPRLGPLLMASFLSMVPFAALQATLSVLAKQSLGWTVREVSAVFLVIGLTGVFTQGFLLRRWLSGWSERRLVWVGSTLMVISFVLVVVAADEGHPSLLYWTMALFALGQGMQGPAITSLVSGSGGPHMQGRLQGANQSVQALGRVIGPLLGGYAYYHLGPTSSYLYGWVLFLGAGLFTDLALRRPEA